MADPFSFAIASVAQVGISFLFPSEGPRIKDLKVSASTYGASIPWVFGLCRVPGNMIWATQPKEHKKKKWRGKGGYYNQYTYTCSFAMALCKGPIDGITRIWADSKLIYDATAGASSIDFEGMLRAILTGRRTSTPKYKMRFYNGDEYQLPDSLIVADKGDDDTPAFRGMAYIVFEDMLLTDFGNRVPQITAEVYVGNTTQTVEVSGYTQLEDETPLPTNYAEGESGFDWDRDFAYLRYDESLKQVNLRTGKELQTYTSDNFTFPNGDPLHTLHCVGYDGSVYVTYGDDATHMPIARLDGFSMQAVGTFGTVENHSSTANTSTAFAYSAAMATAFSDQSVEYLLAVGVNGQVGMLRCSTMAYQWGEDQYVGGSPSSGRMFHVCGTDPDTSGNPTFYVVMCSSTQLTLTKINGSTMTVVQTITGTSMSASGVVWDSSTPGAVMMWTSAGVKYISKWSQDTETEAWRTVVTGLPTVYSSQSRIMAGRVAFVDNGRLYIIDTATGGFSDDEVDPATGEVVPGDGSGYALPVEYAGQDSNMQSFDSTREMLNCFDGVEGTVFLNSATEGCTLGSIVDRLLTEGGLSRSQIDLSAINNIAMRGFGWASGTDVKSVIDDLRRIYLFDLVEREGVLVAVLRGDLGTNNGVATIPQNALGSSSPDASDFWEERRAQESDIPSQISLAFMNYNDDYQTSVAKSQRISNPIPTMFSRQQVSMELNIVLTPTEAKAQTRKMLYAQWAERIEHSTHLPWAYLNLDPSDVITVEMNDGRSYKDRLHHVEIGADFTMEAQSYSQDAGAYDGWDGISADGGGTGPQVLPPPTLAVPVIMNTPLLRDQDDTGGSVSRYYTGLASGTYTDSFGGGALYRSTNNLDYDMLGAEDSDLEWGTVVGKLEYPHAGPYALDWQTRLTIVPSVPWFVLESITDDELWAGANPCLVGDEVIQFRDAVENEDGTWTIWNLLRGRRGTDYAVDRHSVGERFIFLSNDTISLQGDTTNARGLARYFKGVGDGRTLGAAPVYQITYEPRDLMPYAPAFIQRELVASTGDVDITWARRTRLGGNMQDGTGEVALSETSESYEIYILDAPFEGDLSRGAAPEAYRRMYTTTAPTATYTAADQATDGFNVASDTLHVAIYQLSGVVGRGFPGIRDIAPEDEV